MSVDDGAVTVAVTPGASAKLVSRQGNVTVELKAGAVASPGQLRYQLLAPEASPPLPSGYFTSQGVFALSVLDTTGQATGPSSFLKPLLINVRLNVGDQSLAGGVASNVVIQHFEEDEGRWTQLPTTVDFRASTAQAQVNSLSISL